MYDFTTNLSIVLDNSDVIEIGRQSAGTIGFETFGSGVMTAVFHCVGTREHDKDKLKMCCRGDAKIDALIRGTMLADHQAQQQYYATYPEVETLAFTDVNVILVIWQYACRVAFLCHSCTDLCDKH